MKRAIALMLAAVMLIGMTACKQKQAEETDAPATSTGLDDPSPGPGDNSGREESEEDETNETALSLLADIPYYGDKSKCKMTAEQATAFAQLLADGMMGRLGETDEDGLPKFWNDGFQAISHNGPYQTDRSRVILGDFAQDGVPYLYAFSSLVEDNSFTVCGWHDGSAECVYEMEDWMGRSGAYLSEQADTGEVKLVESGSGGAAYHSGADYRFSDGGVQEAYTWAEYEDYETGLWHVVENGVDKTYTADEYAAAFGHEAAPSGEQTAEEWRFPYERLAGVEAKSISIEQMIEALNRYAGGVSGGAAQAVPVPKWSDRQRMALAMLGELKSRITRCTIALPRCSMRSRS